MEIKDFLDSFVDQFDDISLIDLTVGTNFKDLPEWSSLIALSLIAMIDEEYNVTITGVDIQGSSTVEDLFNLVKGKLKG